MNASNLACARFFSYRTSSRSLLRLGLHVILLFVLILKGETTSNSTSTEQMPDMKSTNTNHAEKQKALHSIRQVLENYSDDAIRRILGPTAISSPINEELEPVEIMTTPSTSTNDHKFHDELSAKLMEEDSNDDSTTTTKPKSSGVMRIRADIRSSSSSAQQIDEKPLNRHYRSARHDWLQQHHKKKRKGCPPLHGRDQLLCPSRNTHRYDVCISREQLCDHVVDCPGGEDENVEQCFFFKTLDDQLKTLSHAVLLLVDNIMAESQQRRQEL